MFTDNGNAWHGRIKVSDDHGEDVKLYCQNCNNNVGQSSRIVVDTDDNRYRPWYSKSMACKNSCIIKPVSEERAVSNPCSEKEDGLYRHPTDCHKFQICSNGTMHVEKCPTGLLWNHSVKTCDSPTNVYDCK